MIRITTLLVFLVTVSLFAACGSAPANNATANGNGNGAVKLDNNNLPPGLSTSPVPVTGASTPGIPANPTAVPKGATPTPGIPSPEELKKGMKPGVTPTPGIPSPEEIRRQMSQQPQTGTPPAPDAPADTPMMKKDPKKLPKKPQ